MMLIAKDCIILCCVDWTSGMASIAVQYVTVFIRNYHILTR